MKIEPILPRKNKQRNHPSLKGCLKRSLPSLEMVTNTFSAWGLTGGGVGGTDIAPTMVRGRAERPFQVTFLEVRRPQVADVKKTLGIGMALVVGGVLWTTLWRDWGDLWKVLKGGIGLLFFGAALIFLLMGFFQWREDSEKLRREQAEKRQEEERKAVG